MLRQTLHSSLGAGRDVAWGHCSRSWFAKTLARPLWSLLGEPVRVPFPSAWDGPGEPGSACGSVCTVCALGMGVSCACLRCSVLHVSACKHAWAEVGINTFLDMSLQWTLPMHILWLLGVPSLSWMGAARYPPPPRTAGVHLQGAGLASSLRLE